MENMKADSVSRIQEFLRVIQSEISGENAYEYIKCISKYHRIQASPGYREAAVECRGLLENNGVQVEIKSYPADLKTSFFTQKLFKEWNCREANLDVAWPYRERLADFSKDSMSVIQRSSSVDFRDRELDIVYIPDELLPKDYEEDLTGKVLFVLNGYDRWVQRAVELNACGLITVSMPEIKPVRLNAGDDPSMADKCANLSFHIYNEKFENKLFGFTLTPEKGRRLKEICFALQREGKYVKANAYVDSEMYDGFIENVTADIKGETEDEILMAAHLCHPKHSVNDNASGAACAVEVMRSLNTLIKNGKLKKPRRSIRMLLMPEFTGTYAYIGENEKRLGEIKAGINLDMVGARQNENAGALLVIDTPDAAHSFAGDLCRIILDQVRKECPLSSHDQYTGLFNSEVKPFMLGSDHYILSDPTVQIPSVALTQWPDKMYHTSGDSIENIDSAMLYRVASIAAGYVYALADMNISDMSEIMYRTRERIFQRVTKLAQREENYEDIKRQAGYCIELAMKTCEDYKRFFTGEELSKAELRIEEEKRYLLSLVRGTIQNVEGDFKTKFSPVPERLFTAPLSTRCMLSDISPELKRQYEVLKSECKECSELDDYIIYAINGIDSEEDIAGKVEYETGIECVNYVHKFIEFLHKSGLIIFATEEINNGKQDD